MKRSYRVDALPTFYLDFLVAKVERVEETTTDRPYDQAGFHLDARAQTFFKTTDSGRTFYYRPCVDWRQGGPLLEKHRISVTAVADGWRASQDGMAVAYGPTLLIAAMRSLVIRHYGDVVEFDE
jgi:hypothetical protein